MAETPLDLLRRWVTSQAAETDGSRADWFDEALTALGRSPVERDLHMLMGLAPRRLGKADLALDAQDLAAADAARPGWDPSRVEHRRRGPGRGAACLPRPAALRRDLQGPAPHGRRGRADRPLSRAAALPRARRARLRGRRGPALEPAPRLRGDRAPEPVPARPFRPAPLEPHGPESPLRRLRARARSPASTRAPTPSSPASSSTTPASAGPPGARSPPSSGARCARSWTSPRSAPSSTAFRRSTARRSRHDVHRPARAHDQPHDRRLRGDGGRRHRRADRARLLARPAAHLSSAPMSTISRPSSAGSASAPASSASGTIAPSA